MRSNDLPYILGLNEAVPDRLRIDDHRRPVLALLKAAGLVRSYHVASDSGVG
jgi:hypothetical protein